MISEKSGLKNHRFIKATARALELLAQAVASCFEFLTHVLE